MNFILFTYLLVIDPSKTFLYAFLLEFLSQLSLHVYLREDDPNEE